MEFPLRWRASGVTRWAERQMSDVGRQVSKLRYADAYPSSRKSHFPLHQFILSKLTHGQPLHRLLPLRRTIPPRTHV